MSATLMRKKADVRLCELMYKKRSTMREKPDAGGTSGEGLVEGFQDRDAHGVGCQTFNNDGQEPSHMVKIA